MFDISGTGGITNRQFIIQGGKVYDAAQWRKDNAEAIAKFGQPEEMTGIDLGGCVGGEFTPVEVDLSGVGELDASVFKAPEGYDNFVDYLEDWSLAHLKETTVTYPTDVDQIYTSPTDVFDFVMGDKAETMDPSDWYTAKNDVGYQIKRAQVNTNRAARGQDVDPDDLLVTIGDQKFSLAELDTMEKALQTAKGILDQAQSIKTSARFDSRFSSNWLQGTNEGFYLLAVKKGLSQSGIDSSVADKIYQRTFDSVVKEHEQNYSIQCQIDDMLGRPHNGFKPEYDYSSGLHSLEDSNAFMSDIFWEMSRIDVSGESALRHDFGEFADWFAAGIEESYKGNGFNMKPYVAEQKESLFHLKTMYGL